MESLLKPVILDYFSRFRFPPESAILQVVGERTLPNPNGDITRTAIQFALSDGHYWFTEVLARGTPPGMHSLIRIRPSKMNEVITMWSVKQQEYHDFISLLDWVKILDGKDTPGRMGNAIEIVNVDL